MQGSAGSGADGVAVVLERLLVLGACLDDLAFLLQLLRFFEDFLRLDGVFFAGLRRGEALARYHERQRHQ